jgi:ribosomal protein S18 acetylase RimI-like enzyme
MTDVLISPVEPADVGEVLTLQRAAYVTEAQLYGDVSLPPLTETYDEVAAELSSCLVLKAVRGHRIVGAGRARVAGSILHIGRLAVAPDMQGRGIGTLLLEALERQAPPNVDRYALFTGHLSTANIRLYERLGYTEVGREELKPGVVLVHLEKVNAQSAG